MIPVRRHFDSRNRSMKYFFASACEIWLAREKFSRSAVALPSFPNSVSTWFHISRIRYENGSV